VAACPHRSRRQKAVKPGAAAQIQHRLSRLQ
jgi:hypothetical protein